jgi:hypothetical protein
MPDSSLPVSSLHNRAFADLLFHSDLRLKSEIQRQFPPMKYHIWQPFDMHILDEIITFGEHRSILHPGQKVIDLGSGSGSAVIYWAMKGYHATGIEMHEHLVTKSKELKRKFPDLPGSAQFIQGSYIPEAYAKKRKEQKTLARKLEEEHNLPSWAEGITTTSEDVYAKNHLLLTDFDVVYSYLWPFQGPSVLELFLEYAREDALLIGDGPRFIEQCRAMGLHYAGTPDNCNKEGGYCWRKPLQSRIRNKVLLRNTE